MGFLIIIIFIAIFLAAIIFIAKNTDFSEDTTEQEKQRAGKIGEIAATREIKSVLRDEDLLFNNIKISLNDKSAELDNVIVNKFGVFIIEVKNYNGCLYGDEDDYEWIKYKDDGYGNTFKKRVRNPIKQVKRQVYILSKYLDYYGSRVWVKGYAMLVRGNSPAHSTYILQNIDDIDRVIDTMGKTCLSKEQIESIAKLIRQ